MMKAKNFMRRGTKLLQGVALIFALLNLPSSHAQGVPDPGADYGPVINLFSSWSFNDTNFWASDLQYQPLSSTHVVAGYGDGSAVLLDGGNTNPVSLRYNVVEADGTTNLDVKCGTISLFFAPRWSSVDRGGAGAGSWGRLIEVGTLTDNASYGWWSLYLDPEGAHLYFSSQASGNEQTYFSAPISWVSNQWHFIALTYSPSNTSLTLDGNCVTNGAGVTCYPEPEVLAKGFRIGSESNGLSQACGQFDDIRTYDGPLDSGALGADFLLYSIFYWGAAPMSQMASAVPLDPTTAIAPIFDVFVGPGLLQPAGTLTSWTASSGVWMTHLSFALAASGGTTFTFGVAGGTDGAPYDVFANSMLGTTNSWAWMGQCYPGNIYSLTNMSYKAVFHILGYSQDSDHDGLTDAYERLVSKTLPNNPDSNGDGIPDGWQAANGLGIGNDADLDGLSNWQEYLFGTDPNASEGLNLWLGVPAQTSLIL